MYKQSRNYKLLLLTAILFSYVLQADAATYTSVISGNWNDPATWGSTSYPVAGDTVSIANGHTITVTAGAGCATIVFTGPSGTLTVNSSFILTVSGSITFNKQSSSNASYVLSGGGTLNCDNLAVGSTSNIPITNTIYTHTCTSTIAFLNISGNLDINSYRNSPNRRRNGLFIFEAGIVTVSGSITTYNEHNSNVSTFSMASGAQTGTMLLAGATPFNLYPTGTSTITLNGSSTLVNYNRSGIQTVYGSTYTNLTLSGSGVKTINGVNINGILSIEGTATTTGTSPIFGAASTLHYKGSVAQTTGVEFPAIFPGSGGVIIDNISGVTLNNNRTIDALLTFAIGKITTGTDTLTLGAAAGVSGAGTDKYVNGILRKGIAVGTLEKIFETGDATAYTPIMISFSGIIDKAGSIIASTTSGDHPEINTSSINSSFTVNRYWTLGTDSVSGFTSYSATFTFIPGDLDTGTEYNSLIIGTYYAAGWNYPVTGTRTFTSLEATGLTTFGDFQIGCPMADYRSATSGNWEQPLIWEMFNGASWISASIPPTSANGTITIRASHIVAVNSTITVDELQVESGATLIINNDITIADGPGNDITIDGTLECAGNAILTGTGSFVLSASANIYSGSPDGITSSGYSGSIQTISRTFSDAANYNFNGSSSQVTGNGLPVSVNNLTINNSSGVTLTSSVNINGVLTLTSGEFLIGSNTLTLQTADVPLVRTSGTLTTSSASSLSFGSSGYTGGAAFTIPSGTFTTPAELNNLSVYRTNGLTLNDQLLSVNGIVLCNGPLNTNENLTILSTASGTALIDGSGTGQVTGNVTMQRYFPSGFGYKYVTSPFQAATVNEFSDDMSLGTTFSMFYRYDESRITSGWVSYNSPTDTLKTLHGYAANLGFSAVPNIVDVTGIVNNGSLSRTIYNNNNTYTKGFNLFGNPYPSPIDWDAISGWTKTNIDDALYYFKASATDQYGGTYSTYVNGVSSDSLATGIIPSMQGLFIHVSDGAYPVTGTLSLDNSVRITNLTHPFIKSGKDETRLLLRLTARFSDDTASTDPMVIYFDEKADSAFDSKLDALKLMNTDFTVANLYAIGADGNKLSIDALPLFFMTGRPIPLGIKTYRTGDISFIISSIENLSSFTEIYLSDLVKGTSQDMLNHHNYIVTLDAGEYPDRFFLSVNSPQTEIVSDKSKDEQFRIYCSWGMLMAEININGMDYGTLVISNLTGQTVFTKAIPDPGFYEFNPGLETGIYIVTLSSGNKRISRKLFIYN